MLFLYLSLLIVLISIGLVTLGIVEFKNYFEEEKLRKHLASETAKKREHQAKEKLIKAKSILQSMAQELSIISSTIEELDKISPIDFQRRYQDLWDKSNEAQMLVAFYAPTLKGTAENLDNLLSDYWKKLYSVLVGEQGERTTPNYLEVVEHSQIISDDINALRQKVNQLVN